MSYKAYVVEIKELRKHENADRLLIATVFGNDVVVGLNVEVGDIMVYFPTDGQLSEEFAVLNDLVRRKDENGNNAGGYLDPNKRNIKAIHLRGEKSDGMLAPLSSLSKVLGESYVKKHIKVGDAIDIVNGVEICKKYVPKTKANKSMPKHQSKKISLKDKYPLFQEHRDTSQLAYSLNSFRDGDLLTISLKLHGTSGRTSRTIASNKSWLSKLLGTFGIKLANKWETISGTRRVILENYKGGYYGSNDFRQQYHDLLEGKLHKGETVYYEIVGYADKGRPIMGTVDNKKLKNKEFVKRYGDTTTFTYDCEDGKSDIYIYRMTMTNEDGEVFEYPTWLTRIRSEQMGVKHVPVLMTMTYNEDTDDLLEIANMLGEGSDLIDSTHIREGVIVRVENRDKFTAYKHKSFEFKVLEGIIKEDADEPDMEEAQDLIDEGDIAYA